MNYLSMSKDEIANELEQMKQAYETYKGKNLQLDMSRGKPGSTQLDLSEGLLTTVISNDDCKSLAGLDCRNYGSLEGIPEMRRIFARILGVDMSEIMVGGNSSLNM
ncbi:MAG: aminotransferase, partial [Clostridia bacterium]|nr:aminotransferase [Clostridia bacterium]